MLVLFVTSPVLATCSHSLARSLLVSIATMLSDSTMQPYYDMIRREATALRSSFPRMRWLDRLSDLEVVDNFAHQGITLETCGVYTEEALLSIPLKTGDPNRHFSVCPSDDVAERCGGYTLVIVVQTNGSRRHELRRCMKQRITSEYSEFLCGRHASGQYTLEMAYCRAMLFWVCSRRFRACFVFWSFDGEFSPSLWT